MIEFTKVEGNNHGEIKLFALSTCGWCRKAKKFLEDNNIAFSYVYVDELEEHDLHECLTIKRQYSAEEGYPMITIDGVEYFIGYDINKLNRILER